MAKSALKAFQILTLIASTAGCQATPVAVPPPPPPPPDPVFEVGVDLVAPPTEKPPEVPEGETKTETPKELAEDQLYDKSRVRPSGADEGKMSKADPSDWTAPLPQPAPPPVAAATTEKTGPRVDAAQIQQAVAQRRDLFARCLHVDTSIEIDATISPSGRVLQAKSDRSVPNEPKLRDCIVDAFRKLSLEPFGSDAPAHVKFALALKRK